MEELSIGIAMVAGVVSFFSPCCFPLYPSYLSYLTGISVHDLKKGSEERHFRRKSLLHTLFFILGFSVIFYALGLSFTGIGRIFFHYHDQIRMIGGIMVILMGFFMIGVFKPTFLLKERRFHLGKKRWGYLGSFFVGMGFAAGWTPCVGPVLTSILILAAANPSAGGIYITAYTLGFAVPFFLMSFFIGRMRWMLNYANRLMQMGGVMMILMGVLLYFNQLNQLSVWFSSLTK